LHQRLPLLEPPAADRPGSERRPLRRLRLPGGTGWKARRASGRILEVPITFVERREGASKLSWRVIGESVLLPWRLVLRRG
jgi:hypothetical protein